MEAAGASDLETFSLTAFQHAEAAPDAINYVSVALGLDAPPVRPAGA